MAEEFDVPAFKARLKEHVDHVGATGEHRLLQIGEEKGLVVRRVEFWDSSGQEVFGSMSLEERAALLRESFSELSEKFDIPVAPFRFVVAEDEKGQKTLFSVVDNITPTDVDPVDLDELQVERLGKLVAYYAAKAESGEPYVWDLVPESQYVYGRSAESSDEKLFLVDLDPHIRKDTRGLKSELGELEGEIREHIYDFHGDEEAIAPLDLLTDKIEKVRKRLDARKNAKPAG